MEEDETKPNDSSCHNGNRAVEIGKGGPMNEVELLMKELTKRLTDTKEYIQYKNLLERVKTQPELFHRIGEFRRRGISINMGHGENLIQENNNLQNEFRDLQNNGLVNDFLVAEHQYCVMIRNLQKQLLEGAQIDVSFLEG